MTVKLSKRPGTGVSMGSQKVEPSCGKQVKARNRQGPVKSSHKLSVRKGIALRARVELNGLKVSSRFTELNLLVNIRITWNYFPSWHSYKRMLKAATYQIGHIKRLSTCSDSFTLQLNPRSPDILDDCGWAEYLLVEWVNQPLSLEAVLFRNNCWTVKEHLQHHTLRINYYFVFVGVRK